MLLWDFRGVRDRDASQASALLKERCGVIGGPFALKFSDHTSAVAEWAPSMEFDDLHAGEVKAVRAAMQEPAGMDVLETQLEH